MRRGGPLSLSPSLLAVSLRALLRRPWLSLLCVMGVALGVAVVISIDLANASSSRAFTLATESVTGRATHQVVGGPLGVPEEVYRRLRVEHDERLIAPVVEGYLLLPQLGPGSFRLLGLDPFADAPFRSYLDVGADAPLETLVPLLVEPDTVLLSSDLAARAGLAPGAHLRTGSGQTLRVVGLLSPEDEFSRQALGDLLVADVATAQEALGQVGYLSRIDVLAPAAAEDAEARLTRLTAALPADVQLLSADVRNQSVEQLTAAFELNLTALSLLALVVGTFLIYNTMTFSVVQRRRTLGTLRALGVTRGEIFGMILAEAGLLAFLGSLLGLPLGVLLGRGTVALVTQTVNDFYLTIGAQEAVVPASVLAKGAGLGLLAALTASALPAWEATSIPPSGALRRSSVEGRTRHMIPLVTLAGPLFLLLGVAFLALPGRGLFVSFGSVVAVVLGFVFLTPSLTLLAGRAMAAPLGRLLGPLGRMAPRGVSSALSRTALAIAALMVAVSVSIGVGLMINAFRVTVDRWLEVLLQADLFVSASGATAGPPTVPFEASLQARLAALPGVDLAEAFRGTRVESPDLGPVYLVGEEWTSPRPPQRFVCAVGGAARAQAALADGAVFISEPLAYRQGLTCGDQVRLLTEAGPQTFPVVGVIYDYSTDQGLILMDLARYRALWSDPWVTSVFLYFAPGQDADALRQQVREVVGGATATTGQPVQVRSNRALRQAGLTIFDRTFAITRALQLLAVVVAFIGILSALMALQLERTRELGTLRAIGLTPGQLWGLTLLETGLMGALAGLLAVPTGLSLAAILVQVINRRSFGWSIRFAVVPEPVVQALLVALAAALLAGLYPAWRLLRLPPAEAVRDE
ncbi:MAG: ABC transporter permease [Chloroflexi bacterium]|nr:ABC transporter permease [Chloroflexota bacterium]